MTPAAPIPTGEEQRLRVLREYGVLDTPPERTFDDIVSLAAGAARTPVALVSLIDAQRSWVKAAHGVERGELPRDVAFCSHAICQSEPLVVSDARADGRFAANELVVGEPFVRAYLGVPVVVAGERFGTVAVVDSEPRVFEPEVVDDLAGLARLVSDQFELRRRASMLSRTLERLRTLRGILPVCESCGLVRDGERWLAADRYLASHTGALVSHGLCPRCLPEYLPGPGSDT